MSNGLITKHAVSSVAVASEIDRPLMELLAAVGHSTNSSSPTEQLVILPGTPHFYNAANFAGASTEAKITAMIARGVADGATTAHPRFGFIPSSMLPYSIASVTRNAAMHLVREGQGNWAEYDVEAYGGAQFGPDCSLAFAAILADCPTGATIRVPGAYAITSSITPPTGKMVRIRGNGYGASGEYGTVGSQIVGNINAPLIFMDGGGGAGRGGSNGFEVSGILFTQQNAGSSSACIVANNVINAIFHNLGMTTANHGLLLTGAPFLSEIYACDLAHSGTKTTTSIGIGISGHCNVHAVSAINFGYGVLLGRATGTGFSTFTTLRCELNVVGFCAGLDLLDFSVCSAKAFALMGSSFESNDTGVYLRSGGDFLVAGLTILNDGFGTEQQGLRIGDVYTSLITGVALDGAAYAVAGIVFDAGSGRGSVTVSNCAGGQSGWILPTDQTGFVNIVNCDSGQPFFTLTPNSSTPDIGFGLFSSYRGASRWWKTANTVPTTITQFANMRPVQEIVIQAGDANTTIQHGTNIFLKGGTNRTLALGETIQLSTFATNRWDEI